MQYFTYRGSFNTGVIINFSSNNASDFSKKRGLVEEAYVYMI